MEIEWFNNWKQHVLDVRAPYPGPVRNTVLMDRRGVLRPGLHNQQHYVCVGPQLWNSFSEIYGWQSELERPGLDVYAQDYKPLALYRSNSSHESVGKSGNHSPRLSPKSSPIVSPRVSVDELPERTDASSVPILYSPENVEPSISPAVSSQTVDGEGCATKNNQTAFRSLISKAVDRSVDEASETTVTKKIDIQDAYEDAQLDESLYQAQDPLDDRFEHQWKAAHKAGLVLYGIGKVEGTEEGIQAEEDAPKGVVYNQPESQATFIGDY